MVAQKIVSIVGLTASGKSGLGILLAKKFNGEIVSADSRQVYRGVDIASGKVTKQEQQEVKHHLIDVADINTTYDVATFQEDAYKAIDDILARGGLPFLVGGTGLYSRCIVQGYNFSGDFSRSDKNSRHALADNSQNNKPKYNVLQICLLPPREELLKKVVERTNQRLKDGIIQETKKLLDSGANEDWLNSLGFEYKLTIQFIKGEILKEKYIDEFITKTMQYAKRQRTWFKKELKTIYLTDEKVYVQECERLIQDFLK